ncbi:retrovirus-related pol polyprotein from transposon TNT 1-94 [Tanacetum coccineum]
MTESPLVDSSFVVPVFSPGDDPIACLNKAMAFLTVVASSRFPLTNNQLRTSSNLSNQAIIQDGRVTVQQVPGRQGQSYSGTGQCTQPKRPRNAAWYKEKAMLAEAQEAGKILDEEKLVFLADPGVLDGQAVPTIIPKNVAFQTKDLDTCDSECNDISNAKAALMANISNYGSDVISEVPHSETYLNDMENQSVHTMQDFEQSPAVDFTDNEIHSDSNIIPYSQYLQETQQENVQDTHLQAQQDSMILSVIEQMSEQKINHETLILEEKSRSKLSEKGKDPEVIKKNISHKPIDYEKLNRLSKDFGKRFTPQQEMDVEQAFWFRISNPTIESFNPPPVTVEVPSELPKVSLVNASLKNLKFHLTQFNSVVKKRTTHDARTEGEWGFEHTKAVFNNEIIPFLKYLKDIFNVFDRDLLNEIIEVQTVFDQMDDVVQQFSVDKQGLEIAKKELILENDRLLQQIMSQDVLLTVMNSMSLRGESVNMDGKRTESCNLEAELLKSQNTFNDLLKREKSKEKNVNYDYCEIETKNVELENSVAKLLSENERICNEINHVKHVFKKQFDSIKKTRVHTKEQSDSLIDKLNLKSTENDDLKAQIQDKVFVITSLKNDLRKVKGKEIVDIAAQIPSANTIVPGMFKLDLEPLAPRLLQNRDAHIDYLKYTQVQADIIQKIVEQAKAKQPLDKELDFACCCHTQKQGLKCSPSKCGSKLTGNKKNDRISRPSSRNMKNKVEAKPRKVNNKNRVVEPICDVDVKHSLLNANSEPIYATCKKSMFDSAHDMCLLDFVENVNSRAKSAKKHKNKIFGNLRVMITSANVVPPKKTTSNSVETQKPELKVYNIKPKKVKNVDSSKKANIVESKNANHSEPNHTWGSNATDIPSSSSLVMTGTVRFGNDNIARIMGYGDYHLGNVAISRVYYVEGLGHNLFSVGQFCDADLEVAFRKHTCFIRNLEALKTRVWLGTPVSYLINFDTLNKLTKTVPMHEHSRLKISKRSSISHVIKKRKSKKSSDQPKSEDTNQEKLYLLHMDLCGPMRVASINGKRTNDEAPEAIIKCIKNIQVHLNDTVRNVRTDNRTEFVNQTLREFYENVGILHQTSVTRTPQQNGVVKRRNRTLVEDARTISGLVPNTVSQQPCIPPNRDDWDYLFQPMFDEYFNPPSIAVTPVQDIIAPRAVVLADSPVSTSIDQDAPSTSIPSTQEQEHSPNISQGFEESPKTPIFPSDDPLYESLHEESTSQGSSSNMR